MNSAIRLAIVVSHPIQHFVSFYRMLAQEDGIEVRVLFCSRIGLESYFDPQMQVNVAWNMDLSTGYDHEFLPGADRVKRVSPLEVNNPGVGAALQGFKPDVLLVYGYTLVTVWRALIWAWANGVPAIMTSDSELRSQRSVWRKTLKRAVLPLVLRRFAAFLTAGDNNESYLRHYGVDPLRLFRAPLPIDEPAFLKARAARAQLRQRFRRECRLEVDAFVVLFVGKLAPHKRPGDILLAAELLAQRMPGAPQVRFVFAGDGVLRQALVREAAERGIAAHWLGFVNVDALPAVYAGADALVQPSEIDAHPLVCSEAACLGLPLVISDRVGALGADDLAQPGVNALCYRCGDVEALADALERLISDELLREGMGRASLRIFDQSNLRYSVGGLLAAMHFSVGSRRQA